LTPAFDGAGDEGHDDLIDDAVEEDLEKQIAKELAAIKVPRKEQRFGTSRTPTPSRNPSQRG